MAQNTQPIFALVPQNEWGIIDTANTAKDGTGTVVTIFTADATNGSYCEKIRIRPKGTNVASVLRIFINNGSSNATAGNNVLFDEITLPATTNSEVAALAGFTVPMNIPLAPGYKINITLGTTVAGGYAVSAHGAKY